MKNVQVSNIFTGCLASYSCNFGLYLRSACRFEENRLVWQWIEMIILLYFGVDNLWWRIICWEGALAAFLMENCNPYHSLASPGYRSPRGVRGWFLILYWEFLCSSIGLPVDIDKFILAPLEPCTHRMKIKCLHQVPNFLPKIKKK